jgi:hypothetical protein
MQKILTVLFIAFSFSCLAEKNVSTDNPIKHYIKTHHIPDDSHVLFFKADINSDKLQDFFISCDNESFTNGHLGRIYSAYINCSNNTYTWNHDSNLTLDYNKIIFNDNNETNYKVPILLIEENSIWGCTYNNNKVKEFKLLSIDWEKYPHSPDIFHSILKKDSKLSHPLTTLTKNEALNYKM